MALKAVYDTEDAIPEAHRDLYVAKDGKHVLEVEGIETHPATTALKNALDRVKVEKRTLTEKLAAAEMRMDGLPEDFTAEEYARLKESAGDGANIDARLTAQRTQLEAKAAADLKKKDERLVLVEGALKRKSIDDGLTQALVDAGIDPKHLKLVKGYLAPRVKIEEEDGEFSAVVDTEINPHMPLGEFIKSWAGTDEGKEYIAKPTGGGAPGSDSRKGEVNPWAKETANLTQQGQVVTADPAKARRLMKAAGKSDLEIQAAGVAA
ncbi:MAG: hypothetical protein JWQ03_3015 [Variovorax sp.]|nr:hypothetical protein [Variovorax sp.]